MVVPLWQLSVSSQHMVKSLTVNPYMSLCNLRLCTHIWSTIMGFMGQQILDPPYIGLFGRSWSELSPYGWIWGGGGGRLALRHFFVTDGQKRDYLSRASQRARGATKKAIHTTDSAVELDHVGRCEFGITKKTESKKSFSIKQNVYRIKSVLICPLLSVGADRVTDQGGS